MMLLSQCNLVIVNSTFENILCNNDLIYFNNINTFARLLLQNIKIERNTFGNAIEIIGGTLNLIIDSFKFIQNNGAYGICISQLIESEVIFLNSFVFSNNYNTNAHYCKFYFDKIRFI